MKNAQNSLDLDLFAKQTLLLVTCIQVAPWYNFIGCNFPYLVDTSLGVRPFGQTYDKRSISIETLQKILNLVPPRRTSKRKRKEKEKSKKKKRIVLLYQVSTGSTGLRVPNSRFRVSSTRRRVPSTSRRVPTLPAVEHLASTSCQPKFSFCGVIFSCAIANKSINFRYIMLSN